MTVSGSPAATSSECRGPCIVTRAAPTASRWPAVAVPTCSAGSANAGWASPTAANPNWTPTSLRTPPRRGNHYGFLAWAHRTRRAHRLTITGGPKPLPKTPAADDDQRCASPTSSRLMALPAPCHVALGHMTR